MADMYDIVLDIIAFTAAGIAAWMILISFRDSSRWLTLSTVMSRLEMPPDAKEILRERLVNQNMEGCGGSWSPHWDQPTGDRQ